MHYAIQDTELYYQFLIQPQTKTPLLTKTDKISNRGDLLQ